jgi:hypothetical protein
MCSKRSQMTMLFFGTPFSTNHATTASTVSGFVWIRGGPTGFTLIPMTSSGVKRSRKASFIPLPVNARIPFSTISAATRPSTRSSRKTRASVTLTTRPGKSPGRESRVRGTLRKSSTFVSVVAGVSSPGAGMPSTRPPTAAAPTVAARTNPRRSILEVVGIVR